MSNDPKSILSGLGRATLRGVRKCPNCGTFNGTRGISCKNKKCNFVLKEKNKLNAGACRLVTGNATQIYSVSVKDKNPDCRGFVRLPQIPTQNEIIDVSTIHWGSETALCFIESCQRSFDTSILKCHETNQTVITPMCQHIESAMKSDYEALTLTLRNSILSSLNISNNLKQDIYLLASQTSGPLVQRVSKNVMAVKCLVTSKNPLGYLHITFQFPKNKETRENKFHCGCSDLEYINFSTDNLNKVQDGMCVHLYACLCAFASDPKLSEEFSNFLNSELFSFQSIPKSNNTLPLSLDNQLGLVLEPDPMDYCNIEIEVLNNDELIVPSLPISEVINSNIQVENLQVNPNGEVTIIGVDEDGIRFSDLPEGFESISEADLNSRIVDFSSTFDEVSSLNNKKKISIPKKTLKKFGYMNKLHNKNVKKCKSKKENVVDEKIEEKTNMSFIQWLSSVTERINQTMHYQFNGKPEALIFHIPQVFFDCLRDRISSGGPRKRLPNHVNAFVRKDALPLGTFTKYTWHITNILHVKQIFETPLIPLAITKSFILNNDGIFKEVIFKDDDDLNLHVNSEGNVPIKPSEYKTYLKVGNTSFDQIEPTPFIIEWIPDILPISKIGELRIKFEYGHHQKFTNNK